MRLMLRVPRQSLLGPLLRLARDDAFAPRPHLRKGTRRTPRVIRPSPLSVIDAVVNRFRPIPF